MSKLSVIFKERILLQHPLNKDRSYTIGSSPDVDIFIDSLVFEGIHARIFCVNNKYHFALSEGAEGKLKSQDIDEKFALKDGDTIEIGKYSLRFVEELEIGTPSKTEIHFKQQNSTLTSYWLQFLNGKNVGKTIQLKQKHTNIGKEGAARIVISQADDGYYISHLDGQMVGKLNGKTIKQDAQKLENNSNIELAQIKMLFFWQES